MHAIISPFLPLSDARRKIRIQRILEMRWWLGVAVVDDLCCVLTVVGTFRKEGNSSDSLISE